MEKIKKFFENHFREVLFVLLGIATIAMSIGATIYAEEYAAAYFVAMAVVAQVAFGIQLMACSSPLSILRDRAVWVIYFALFIIGTIVCAFIKENTSVISFCAFVMIAVMFYDDKHRK